jgi:tetratricopeptide (TPR) repeat protein
MNPPHRFRALPSAFLLALLMPLLLPPTGLGAPMKAPDFEEFDPRLLPVESNDELRKVLAWIEAGDLATARGAVDAFLAKQPGSAAGHELAGVCLAMGGDLDGALASLAKAVDIEPKRSTAITKMGDILLARKQVAEAKAKFQQALAVNPADRHACQRLGGIFEIEENFAEAVAHYERGLVGTAPGYVGVKVNLGRLYNRQRRFDETVKLLEAVVAADSPNEAARLALGAAWIGRGEPERAIPLLAGAAAGEAEGAGSRLALGIAQRDAGRLEDSLKSLERALELEPDWQVARYQRAETLAALKRVPEALAAFEEALADSPDPILIRNRMAETCAANERLEEAETRFRAMIQEDVADLRTRFGFATMFQVAGRLKDAEEVLAAACAKHPGDARVLQRLGMHHALALDYERAAVELEKARQLAPQDPGVVKALCLVAQRRGDAAAAVDWARKLVELVPDSRENRFLLATLLESAGRDGEAEALYDGILAADPRHVATLNNLAQVRFRRGDEDGALKLAGEAVALAPEVPALRDTLGWIKYRTGDKAGAVVDLEAAVAGGKGSPTHRYHLALSYDGTGKRDQARAQLEQALSSGQPFAERAEAERLAKEWAVAAGGPAR